MLVCDEVVKKYSSCIAVNNVNMKLVNGNVYAMLGPNGSGKTTLMKMIAGLIKPTTGSIALDGEGIGKETKAHVAYLPTENYFYSYMNTKDVVKFHKDFYEDFDENKFYDLLNKMGLNFSDKVKNMSTGMLAKLKVAVALSRNAKVVLLDEPLNGIDILAREVIMRAISEDIQPDRVIVISSHLVEDLEMVVTGALFMKNGSLVLAGDADKLRNANQKSLVELYKEVYGWGGMYNA